MPDFIKRVVQKFPCQFGHFCYVRYCAELQEYSVTWSWKPIEAEYFTSDAEDAFGTALLEIRNFRNSNREEQAS